MKASHSKASTASKNNLLSASGEKIPEWFTEEFVERIKERMRKLVGQWNGTPFGSEMTLQFN